MSTLFKSLVGSRSLVVCKSFIIRGFCTSTVEFVRTVLAYIHFIAFGLTAKQLLFSTVNHLATVTFESKSVVRTKYWSWLQKGIFLKILWILFYIEICGWRQTLDTTHTYMSNLFIVATYSYLCIGLTELTYIITISPGCWCQDAFVGNQFLFILAIRCCWDDGYPLGCWVGKVWYKSIE